MSEQKTANTQMGDHDRELFSEQLAHQVSFEPEQGVPNWHRAEAFEQHFKKYESKSINWGMWFGVPAISIACSIFSITLVMSYMQDKGLEQQVLTVLVEQQEQQKIKGQLSSKVSEQFNSQITSNDIEALVTLKLREFAAEQQVVLANYRADISIQQQESNLALAGYVIGASRKERKEDISDFISFINAQREDEQLAQKIKFQQLERDVSFQKLTLEQDNSTETSLVK